MGKAKNRVLVVDDDSGVRDMVSEALSSLGIKIISSGDGLEAQRILSHEKFDIVILDIHLPGMDGIELACWIKEHKVDSEIVIITGSSSAETAITAVKLGVRDYLPKPFGIKELVCVVREILERRKIINNDCDSEIIPEVKEDLIRVQRGSIEGRGNVLEALNLVVHDMDDALTAVTSYSSILEVSRKADPKALAILKQVEKTARNSAELTDIMLELTQLTDSRNMKRVSVSDVVREYLISLDNKRGEVEISSELDAGLPFVTGNPCQLIRVVDNLVQNAFDAMPHGGRLHISTSEISPDEGFCCRFEIVYGKYVTITVKDNGTGIGDKLRGSFFKPFFTTKKGHCGLGLTIVSAILSINGGTVEFTSEEGVGSEFTAYIPAVID